MIDFYLSDNVLREGKLVSKHFYFLSSDTHLTESVLSSDMVKKSPQRSE